MVAVKLLRLSRLAVRSQINSISRSTGVLLFNRSIFIFCSFQLLSPACFCHFNGRDFVHAQLCIRVVERLKTCIILYMACASCFVFLPQRVDVCSCSNRRFLGPRFKFHCPSLF